MLERAALHQTRFRTPGVSPDQRGVVLGQRGLILFPSLDRLVAFFRAYGDEGSLDELLGQMQIHRVITPLKTREVIVNLLADSSYRMDRVAGVAKLAGGLVFTGTQRHFVKYRDAGSPLGYDVEQLLDRPADVILYDESFQQTYTYEREIDFRDLVFKLNAHRVAVESGLSADEEIPEQLFATAEVGIGHALIAYLFRWQVDAKAALAEWASDSAFDDTARRLHIFELKGAPTRIVRLMESIPGVRVYVPEATGVAVELGHRHPIALSSCARLFESGLTLFPGGEDVLVLDPVPPFAPVRALVRAGVGSDIDQTPSRAAGAGLEVAANTVLPLKLAHSSDPWRRVIATVVPLAERDWLGRMLYALPPRTIAALRVAIGQENIYLIDPDGIEGVPLGRFYSEVAKRIYVPAGLTLVPAVAPAVLQTLVEGHDQGHVFFLPERPLPVLVPQQSFGPLTRTMIQQVAGRVVHADAPERHDPGLPLLQYDEARRFPLRGVPRPPEPK